MILLIDNYDSFTYNLYHLISELNYKVEVYRNDKISVGQILALSPQAIIISPGPSTPNEAGICLEMIACAKEKIPIFGVCLGLQAIAQAFGGKVIRAPQPMHGKISNIHHFNKGIFAELPQDFSATRYHSLIVERTTLPECLEITAEADDGTIMALQHKQLSIHAVQFHPESIASHHGADLFVNFMKLVQKPLKVNV